MRTSVHLSVLVVIIVSAIVHGRKSACGIAGLRAASAAGSLPWPAPLEKPSSLSLRPSASGFHKKSIPLLLQGKAPPCHITGLSPGLTRNKVLRMEISFGKLQYLALELVSLNPPRPSLSCLEIAPSSQLTFEERGIGHSAGRRSRPAQ